jgi:hypothetical protein
MLRSSIWGSGFRIPRSHLLLHRCQRIRTKASHALEATRVPTIQCHRWFSPAHRDNNLRYSDSNTMPRNFAVTITWDLDGVDLRCELYSCDYGSWTVDVCRLPTSWRCSHDAIGSTILQPKWVRSSLASSLPQPFDFSGYRYQYDDPSKPQLVPHYYPEIPAEQIIPRQPATRRWYSKDTTEYKLNGNKYGQWVSWGSIITIWLAGCIIGLIGSVSIAVGVEWSWPSQRNHEMVLSATGCYGGVHYLGMLLWWNRKKAWGRHSRVHREWRSSPLGMDEVDFQSLSFLPCVQVVYMDWLLAAVTNNWSGVPSKLDKGGKMLY